MKICICDDDIIIREKIKELLQKNADINEIIDITAVSCGEELLELFGTQKQPDIVFLDIEMNGINGLETAERIREKSESVIIIFVSAHPSYVFDSFSFDALYFLCKPLKEEEFVTVMARANEKYKRTRARLTIRWHGERYSIPVNDIRYIEGYNRHIMVHTASESFEAVGRLSDVYQLLSFHGFVSVHQGYIVNMKYIRIFKNDAIILHGNKTIPVSLRKRQQALKIYDDYIQKRM